ncbi:TlpA family protein disulfide reductase [Pedobacter montanisoli]|uniref:TlpA family protein disulfide reductase n=1 Tax=Pedobacter montanisoli TaxID=2923277 RepID=A0ABS9ZT27_9SPHI|nr:TlpA disulfide reductase family protein [Pedobacter montanisoli]MCJ0741478.1 TlpA family protein disulfide reductase [Pedobacter montanisoli]
MDGILVSLRFEDKVLKVDTVRNGKFEMQAVLPSNRIFNLSFYDPKPEIMPNGMPLYNSPSVTLFSDDENSEIMIKANNIKQLARFGDYQLYTSSKNQIDYNRYQADIKKDREDNEFKFAYLVRKQSQALRNGSDSLYTLYSDSLRFQEKLNKTTHNQVTKRFIANNPNTYVAMYLLSKRLDLKNNLAFYQVLYDKAERKYKKSWYGLYFAKRVEQLEKLRKNYVKIFNINAHDSQDSIFRYSKYSNSKLLVFDFWATWCAPCMEDIPAALKLEKELVGKQVSYIFFSYDFNNQYWKQQSKKQGLTHSFYLSESTRRFLNEELGVLSIPRYMILNNKGEILVVDAPSPSTAELKKLIEHML